tara:strand:- start:700 stop:942 length:243 start_codon:yes stop_codon:yes gene_type:complete
MNKKTYTNFTYYHKSIPLSLANKIFDLDRIKNTLDNNNIMYYHLKDDGSSFSFISNANDNMIFNLFKKYFLYLITTKVKL